MFGTKNINTTPLSQKAILDRLSEYDLWVYYLGHCNLNKAFNSPLRKDKRPSAVLFVASNNKILLKDFATGEVYDVFKFIQIQGYTYKDVLLKIDSDFRLGFCTKEYKPLKSIPIISDYKPEYKKELSQIMIKRKPWDKKSSKYWEEYHVQPVTLEKYKVSNLECFWVTKGKDVYLYHSKNLTFCYDFGEQKYKIYRPHEVNYRFITNTENDILQGEDQLIFTDDLLIITKALKDVMVLHEMGYNAIAVQGENSFPSKDKIDSLKRRFEHCVVLFDNDIPGVEGSNKICILHNLKSTTIPKDSKAKDIAEYVKLYGIEKGKNLIKCLIEIEPQVIIGKEK